MFEEEMGLDGVDYIMSIYIHEESEREVSLLIIDPTKSSTFEAPSSTTTTTILKTKEGYIITIGDLIEAREDFTNKLQSLFEGVIKNDYSAKDDTLLPNKVEMSNYLRSNLESSGFDGSNLNIVFTYISPQVMSIGYNEKSNINTNLGTCSVINIKNIDTNEEGNNLRFINGQVGHIVFDCDEAIENDKFIDSSFTIFLTDSQLGTIVPNNITVRLNWN
jgi:hypothetical protein